MAWRDDMPCRRAKDSEGPAWRARRLSLDTPRSPWYTSQSLWVRGYAQLGWLEADAVPFAAVAGAY